MARPTKQGVDYFPLDVHLDDKFKFIEIKYKLEGFAILIKLMQKIYSCGYWYRWTEDEALLFSDEIRTDFSTVENVVNECLVRGVFDNNMFEKHNILTSKGIQKRYKEIVRRRKDVEVIEEYLLIDDTMTTLTRQDDDNKTTNSKQDDIKSTQSKVKESKVKETKQKVKYDREQDLTQYRDYVFLTPKEYDRLVDEYGKNRVEKMLDKLDSYKGAKGKKYKDDNKAIRSWVVEEILKQNPIEKVNYNEYQEDRNVVSQVSGSLF
ncbi:DUF4373 domain-containing protein [Cytobacillus sp. FSL R5-0596]|uniref:DUF4373 domain-containing protein n=1 Tax=Cytobacillus sp. FSL R5-0596 TaxID=2954696 RepID=UPI0030F60831